MNNNSIPEPAIIVIFGVTGDLVKRKLLPALYNLIKNNYLNPNTVIVGATRQNINLDELIDRLASGQTALGKDALKSIKKHLQVKTMNVTKGSDYKKLLATLNEIEESRGMCMNRLYYLSIPPQVFGPIVNFLGEYGLNDSCQHGVAQTRLLVEKPFGYNLASAKELIEATAKHFKEDQIFRIDHYLAKETVQNVLTFRFSNAIFESIWNRQHISHINITASEEIGIENRVSFYEQTGALKDLIQSHLLQLLTIVTMEQPTSLNSDSVHKSRLALLNDVVPIAPNMVDKMTLRGQYKSYRKEVDNPRSYTETFAALNLSINNSRWRGVPIVIQTGKSLRRKFTEIEIVFKRTNRKLTNTNNLTFRIEPNEGIDLGLSVKKPGLGYELQEVKLDFTYQDVFKPRNQPLPYERVLIDAIKGDHMLFSTSKEVIESWKIINNVVDIWGRNATGLQIYDNNSNGPTDIPSWLSVTTPKKL